MKYTQEQVDIMIESSCKAQKRIDYKTFENIVRGLSVEDFINYDYYYTKKT